MVRKHCAGRLGGVHSVTDTTQAYIDAASMVSKAGGLTVSASDTSSISTGAGQAAVSTGYTADGAAIIVNRISNIVTAYIGGSTVTAGGDVSVSALSNESIEAIAIGVGASVSNKKFGLDLVGSGRGTSHRHTEAYIQGGSVTTTGTGSVNVTAEDEAHITAIAGAVSIAVAKQGGASAAVGASAAYNRIGTSGTPDPVWA